MSNQYTTVTIKRLLEAQSAGSVLTTGRFNLGRLHELLDGQEGGREFADKIEAFQLAHNALQAAFNEHASRLGIEAPSV